MEQIEQFIKILAEWNKKFNLFSRSLQSDDLKRLIAESLTLGELVKYAVLIDVGSGNGLLGVPNALAYPKRKVYLIESKPKKADFLNCLIHELKIKNLNVFNQSYQEFFHHFQERKITVCCRAFPDLKGLITLCQKIRPHQFLTITTSKKISEIEKIMEFEKKSIYNIPLKDQLKIFEVEYVSRETKK